ncbi:MAG: polysaccharide deacetylase family protein [Candidatus Moraniibacteriota bacterium]|nr:MAG: polysaccharide deacetylase family protein [Candidatus Moranbacteria bacterium]
MISSRINNVLCLVRRLVYACLRCVDFFLPRRAHKVVIFSYHSIARDNWRFSIDLDVFRKQIESLLTQYRPLTLSEAWKFLRGLRSIEQPSFVITFDDGYRDILEVKDFLLEKGISPTLFVLSDAEHVDGGELGTSREFLSTSEIQELYVSGWEIGCHSATHGDFWEMSEAQIQQETAGAKRVLEERFGFPVRYFAYPRGRYTKVARRLIGEAGYDLALSMDDGFLSPETDPFVVPRVGVDRTHSHYEFFAIHTDAAILFRKIAKKIIGRFL